MPCHTGDNSKPFAGGLPIHTPFGILYSVNITSDPQTGIGKWSFADFKNALHNGIRADGVVCVKFSKLGMVSERV